MDPKVTWRETTYPHRASVPRGMSGWHSGRRIGDRDRHPVGGDDGLVRDDTAWWALDRLHGTDVPADESGAYLHDDEQLRARLAELRKRRTV